MWHSEISRLLSVTGHIFRTPEKLVVFCWASVSRCVVFHYVTKAAILNYLVFHEVVYLNNWVHESFSQINPNVVVFNELKTVSIRSMVSEIFGNTEKLVVLCLER